METRATRIEIERDVLLVQKNTNEILHIDLLIEDASGMVAYTPDKGQIKDFDF